MYNYEDIFLTVAIVYSWTVASLAFKLIWNISKIPYFNLNWFEIFNIRYQEWFFLYTAFKTATATASLEGW